MSKVSHTLPWTESPFFERELRESQISEADKAFVKQFAEFGYVIFDPKIPDNLIENLKKELAPHFDQPSLDQKPTNRLQDAWHYNENVKKIATSEEVLRKLTLLYQGNQFLFKH